MEIYLSKLFLSFVMDNYRFLLAFIFNFFALICSVYWFLDVNVLNAKNSIELEPLVTTLALCATLFGFSFINNKLTRPNVKVSSQLALAYPPRGGEICFVVVDVQNHSISKVYLSSFIIILLNKDVDYHLVRDAFTNEAIGKVALNPGQAFRLYVDSKVLDEENITIDKIGGFVVSDDIGRKFSINAKNFRATLQAVIDWKKR